MTFTSTVRAVLHLSGEGQGVPGGSQEHRDAAGDEGLRQALTGLAVARHDQAEDAAGHALQHAPVRLHLQLVEMKLLVCARHLQVSAKARETPYPCMPSQLCRHCML